MNRKIEFRAWNKIEKKMFYMSAPVIHWTDDHIEMDLLDNEDRDLALGSYNPEDWILSQFTGLYDRNNQKIFESDVVKVKLPYGNKSGLAEIVWSQNRAQFGIRGSLSFQPNYEGLYSLRGKKMEVVGNIFQNPDLLTNLDQNKDG